MFESLTPQPADKILEIMTLYREDPRSQKVDLGVGVYKNSEGQTPVMRAVREAERRLWDAETTKSYVNLVGDPAFSEALRKLVLGPNFDASRVSAAATPGGTGAVRLAFDLFHMASPKGTVWVSDPTWPNHLSILKYLGLSTRPYRYFDAATRTADIESMLADLAETKAGDLILLHGCCHNPTGANLSGEDWARVTEVLSKTGAVPMIDIAYQGFGDGLDADAAGLREIARNMPEVVLAVSCSKNFGVYRERAGAIFAITPPERQGTMQGTLSYLNRQTYSFPPDHGARLVTMVLNDPELRADWEAELADMRTGMLDLRAALAAELRQRTNSDRFDFLAHHRGMFSRLGATPDQVHAMREQSGIYMTGDSRMNIAGLNASNVPILAEAIVAAGV
ncbi:MAG: amino acid aminotransferase [Pseudomonadota bacterium]